MTWVSFLLAKTKTKRESILIRFDMSFTNVIRIDKIIEKS